MDRKDRKRQKEEKGMRERYNKLVVDKGNTEKRGIEGEGERLDGKREVT
jgi:hypothetical protein